MLGGALWQGMSYDQLSAGVCVCVCVREGVCVAVKVQYVCWVGTGAPSPPPPSPLSLGQPRQPGKMPGNALMGNTRQPAHFLRLSGKLPRQPCTLTVRGAQWAGKKGGTRQDSWCQWVQNSDPE